MDRDPDEVGIPPICAVGSEPEPTKRPGEAAPLAQHRPKRGRRRRASSEASPTALRVGRRTGPGPSEPSGPPQGKPRLPKGNDGHRPRGSHWQHRGGSPAPRAPRDKGDISGQRRAVGLAKDPHTTQQRRAHSPTSEWTRSVVVGGLKRGRRRTRWTILPRNVAEIRDIERVGEEDEHSSPAVGAGLDAQANRVRAPPDRRPLWVA